MSQLAPKYSVAGMHKYSELRGEEDLNDIVIDSLPKGKDIINKMGKSIIDFPINYL